MRGESAILKRIKKTVSITRIDFEQDSSVDTSFVDFIQSKYAFEGNRALSLPNWFEYALNRTIEVKDANRV